MKIVTKLAAASPDPISPLVGRLGSAGLAPPLRSAAAGAFFEVGWCPEWARPPPPPAAAARAVLISLSIRPATEFLVEGRRRAGREQHQPAVLTIFDVAIDPPASAAARVVWLSLS